MSKFYQRGISLYISVIILSIILAIVLGLSTILLGEIIMIKRIGYSVIALYAADTGVEAALKNIYSGSYTSLPQGTLKNGSSYLVEVVCCVPLTGECAWDPVSQPQGNYCPEDLKPEDSSCLAPLFCIRSVGTFKKTKRAIEVKI